MEKSIKQLVACNLSKEGTAIEEYYNLLESMELQHYDQDDINIIKEIISDEKNHIVKLSKLSTKYDNIPINKN